ncbi:MAG: hypothetical protein PHH59_01500 [Methylovulum sp.]|uniref:hypothetical protein n=1 Tax=Methylovulum sp. TaxID=1916980 RepID=UPI002636E1B4|nr:hypothetical protein [Methylovulum sp.]MDD2722684.1 hypothetical protein [Methylovulum sp.]
MIPNKTLNKFYFLGKEWAWNKFADQDLSGFENLTGLTSRCGNYSMPIPKFVYFLGKFVYFLDQFETIQALFMRYYATLNFIRTFLVQK